MKQFGIIILIAGIILGIYALSMDTTVEVNHSGYNYSIPERVYNIGLINEQRNLLIVSGVMSIIGLIMIISSTSIESNGNKKTDFKTLDNQQKILDNTSEQNVSNIADDLKKIKELLHSGLINQEEFDKMRNRLIDTLDKSSTRAIKQNQTKSNDINKKHFKYTAPEYKIINKTEKRSFFHGLTHRYLIEFNDGEKAKIYVIQKNKYSYFKAKPEGLINVRYTYMDFESCINAVHYFLKNRKELKTGLISIF